MSKINGRIVLPVYFLYIVQGTIYLLANPTCFHDEKFVFFRKRLDMKQNDKRFLVEKPQPVYDEKGSVKYCQDDEYVYVRHNGELLSIEQT